MDIVPTNGVMEAAVLAGVVLLFGLVLAGLWQPQAWSLLGVLLIGSGVGLLVWGIVAAALGEVSAIGSNAGVIGLGAGALAGGSALLVVSFVRRGKRSGTAGEPHSISETPR